MDSFPWDKYSPSVDLASETSQKRILSAAFGDGYEQTAPDGINTDISTYSVSWNYIGEIAKEEIYNFLKLRLNATPFLFKLPDWPAERQVKCTAVNKTYSFRGVYSVTTELKRDYTIGG